MLQFSRLQDAADYFLKEFPHQFHIATPLGLGKPNQLINLIYRQLKKNPAMKAKIFTALSLTPPHPQKSLEKKFLQPFLDRHFGKDYPSLEYALDQKRGALPKHIQVHEFYMQAGQYLHAPQPQQQYTSINYTHVAQSLLHENLDVFLQIVSKRVSEDGRTHYSLSCNPDMTLDLIELYRKSQKKIKMVGVVHPQLPFMEGDAEVDGDFFDVMVDSPEVEHELFALPRTPLNNVDHMIGLYASQLIADDGTLQIGIGSLSDAIVVSTLFRQKHNPAYREMVKRLWQNRSLPKVELFNETFSSGLYGTSEMVMDAFMHLRKAGILKREIFDEDEQKKRFLHGAFFLGSKDFYQWLRDLPASEAQGIGMTRVSKVNDLYDAHEMALRRQRQKARFFNTCMNVTLLGGAASDTLENGQVVSGVGGQYNFVAMSQELPDSHSILLLKSTRTQGKVRKSNILWSHGHITIPRHLRDIVVTEYGIAVLKSRTDEECIQALLEIADSEFQHELMQIAKKNGKLSKDYQIPSWARDNTPQSLQSFLSATSIQDVFVPYPLGSDFTLEEQNISLALIRLQESAAFPNRILKILWKGIRTTKQARQKELERLQLFSPTSITDWFYQKLVLGALKQDRNSKYLR